MYIKPDDRLKQCRRLAQQLVEEHEKRQNCSSQTYHDDKGYSLAVLFLTLEENILKYGEFPTLWCNYDRDNRVPSTKITQSIKIRK